MKGLQDECGGILRAQGMQASWWDATRVELLRRPCQCSYTGDRRSGIQRWELHRRLHEGYHSGDQQPRCHSLPPDA
jgi:hypothetical protein